MSEPGSSSDMELIFFSDLESRRQTWSELAERSGNIFGTWEWISAWWRHFEPRGEPAFVECRNGSGRTFAILPLYRTRRGPFRLLRLLGHGPGDVLGPICDPADAELAGLALKRVLRELPGRQRILLAERLPGGLTASAFGGRILQEEANPELHINSRTWDEYLASCSRNIRQKLGRNTRKLERDHKLGFRLCEDAHELDSFMDTLLRLHKARWGPHSSFAQESVVGFHRHFAEIALKRAWLRLWVMEVDDQAVAAWYGFRFGATESFYQSGRNPDFDKYSVGFLMLMRTMRSAFDDGLERYAFLRGDEPYKERLADLDRGLESRVLTRGPLSGAVVACGTLVLRFPWMRKRITAAMR